MCTSKIKKKCSIIVAVEGIKVSVGKVTEAERIVLYATKPQLKRNERVESEHLSVESEDVRGE
jgi:hypothetical protein